MENINTISIMGLLYGDEGKGKIAKILSKDADYIVKYIGGLNSSHSIYLNDEKIKLNLMPSGVVNNNSKYIFSSDVSLDINVLFDEIDKLKLRGINADNLFIDERVNIVMPYHMEIDKARGNELGKNVLDISKNGITPCYHDKISRIGIRAADLLNISKFEEKITKLIYEKNIILEKYNFPKIEKEDILKKYRDYAFKLVGKIVDVTSFLNQEILKGKKVFFEGSSGFMLDINYGSYPFVSSSSLTTGTLCSSVGIAPNKLKEIYGVLKVYVTREDDGILLTEIIDNEEEKHFKKDENEYMFYKEKYRRCGWLDLVLAKHGILINGVNNLVITKLDILSKLKEIKVAIAYDIGGKVYQTYPGINFEKEEVEVLYKTFPGWDQELSKIQKYEDLPLNAKNFIEFIEDYLDVKIKMISVGKNDKETIMR